MSYTTQPRFYQGIRYQTGHGFFTRLFRGVIPLLRKGGKYLGKRLLHTAFHTAKDVLDGAAPKEALKQQAQRTVQKIGKDGQGQVIRMMRGKGSGCRRIMLLKQKPVKRLAIEPKKKKKKYPRNLRRRRRKQG